VYALPYNSGIDMCGWSFFGQVTAPVSSTTFAAGKPNTVSWQDNGQQPTLQAFGPAIVSIYAGNSQQQVRSQSPYWISEQRWSA